MAAGTMMLVKKGATLIACVRTVELSVDHTPIDISSYDDTGYQKLLATSAQRVMSLTVGGVESDHVLRDIGLGTSALITDLTITFPNALATNDVVAGDFFMTNYKESGDYKDAGLFTATFTSSGAWTRA